MVGTIGAATSGFGGVAGYCCGGGGGGEEREEERMPGLSGAKEEERERDEAGSLSARERQQEQERHGPGRSAGGQGDDEERERRRAEREKKVETEARRVRRVEWTETRNLATNDPMRAARIMEATARDASELKRLSGVKATGRKLTKPLCHYSLSWGKDERPSRQEMGRAVTGSLQALGLEDRQALIVAHGDTKCPHVHVIVNRVSPEHGKAAKLSGSRLKLSKWAEGYERRQGRIRCQHRVWNNAKRARGERVRREPRLPRSRWQRERRHSVQMPRAKTPAGLSPAERSEWKNQERGARDSWIGHDREMNLRGLSTRAGKEWRELYDRHRQEKAAEKQAGTTVWRRIRRWREKGSRLGQLRAALTRDSQLWRDWRTEIEVRHKQERAALGQTHSSAARKIEQGAAQGYQSSMKGAVDYAKDVVWRQELQAREQARWARDRQERDQGRGPERERDHEPDR